MTGNGSRLAGPVHPDDVDPVSIVGEELCQRDYMRSPVRVGWRCIPSLSRAV
jgi:hypothetical protein